MDAPTPELIKPANCTCGYPEVICRNMVGHPRECPVYAEWMEAHGPKADEADAIPRRVRMDKWTPAEMAIYVALQAVESVGAHPLLTDAAVLLQQARAKVADFVDA